MIDKSSIREFVLHLLDKAVEETKAYCKVVQEQCRDKDMVEQLIVLKFYDLMLTVIRLMIEARGEQ